MGAVIAPVNFSLKENEIEYIVNHSEAKVFIVEDILCGVVERATLPEVKTFITINLSGIPLRAPWLDFESLITGYSDAEPEIQIEGNEMIVLLYTSGTEAKPKGVMGTHINYYMVLLSIALDSGLRSDDIFLVGTPLFHVGALIYQSLSTLAFGGKVVLMYQPELGKIMERIKEENVTFISFPSTIYIAMAQIEERTEMILKSVKVCFTFGAPIPSTVLKSCMKIFPNATWFNYYGLTELSPLGASNPDPLSNPQSVGLSHVPLQIKIVGDEDNELPAGKVGEIVARGPSVMLGYYKDPERTIQCFKNGWLHTGDLGWLDESDNLYFVDRKKDIIKSGGENVSSLEVEEVLFKHPKVAEAAVIGLPHEYWMEAVTAVIVPKKNERPSKEEIINHCKKMLAGYKVPKEIMFVDHIPKNPSGKVLKRELRKLFINQNTKIPQKVNPNNA
jgi:fatty-acyl-CoA synthase